MTQLKHWQTVDRRLLLDRSPWMKIYEDDVELHDGKVIHDYLRLESPGYCMIVPLDHEGRIGLVRSYKRGVDAVDAQPPAGVIDEGEDPHTCAERELLEELGCRAEHLHRLGAFVLSGNYFAGKAHFYLATGCQQVVEPHSGDLEEQQIIWLPWEEARHRWSAGEYIQMSSVAALGLAFAAIDQFIKDGELNFEVRT